MKAWVFHGHGKPLELTELPDPTPAPGEIVIDVLTTGLCHSDVSALEDPAWAVNFPAEPVVLGHEPAGRVSAIGEGVTEVAVGDLVGVPSGPPNLNGYFRDGGYAEKTTAIANAVVKIPEGLDLVMAAAGTDAGNVAHHAVVTRGRVKAGEKVAILGIGGLGQIGARIAVVLGCEVYAVEPREEAWGLAHEIGVKDVVKDVLELAEVGLDCVIDFAGFGTTTAGAIEVVKEHGRVVQVGMGRLESTINTNSLIVKQVDLIGSMGGGVEDLTGVYDLMASGKLKPAVTTVAFEDIAEGLEKLHRGEVIGRLVADLRK